MVYVFLRFAIVPLAFFGWILFQLFVKKKRFHELQSDLLTITAFLIVWGLLIWFIKS
ncbi:MAG: hypothetical protein GXC73_13085 [Chitinophagaceae bacterium]|nr:hypothetical protein [Chitinophagaceae bacterium]